MANLFMFWQLAPSGTAVADKAIVRCDASDCDAATLDRPINDGVRCSQGLVEI